MKNLIWWRICCKIGLKKKTAGDIDLICHVCGVDNFEGTVFCESCGERLLTRIEAQALGLDKPHTRTCPSCGASNEADANFCEMCGTSFKRTATQDIVERSVINVKKPRDLQRPKPLDNSYRRTDSYSPKPADTTYIRQTDVQPAGGYSIFSSGRKDPNGYDIPREYPSYFNSSAWCWPGFWFPAYWCLLKGMTGSAWKYLLVGLIPSVGSTIASIWCGAIGYKEYVQFLSTRTDKEIEEAKSTGLGCFTALIGINIILTILLTALMVAVSREM